MILLIGYVDVFDTSGNWLMGLNHGKWLNAHSAVGWAPGDFGEFSNHILVGNFGSGRIATFDPKNGNFHGFLRDHLGMPLTTDGLWGLGFGHSANAGPANTLFFAAGIEDEAHGPSGMITPLSKEKTEDMEEGDDGEQQIQGGEGKSGEGHN